MPLVLEPDVAPTDLRGRLHRLRRRSRRLALSAGLATAATFSLAYLIVVVSIDAALDVPASLRAVLLVAGVVAAAWLVGRFVWRPWRNAGDELAAARRVERANPVLADALASAVQFRARPEEITGSRQLQDATVLYAVARSRGTEFADLAEVGPTWRAAGLLLLALSVALPVVWHLPHPDVGVARLFDPFGAHPWPPQTTLTVVAPGAIARGEPFELTATFAELVPDRAAFMIALDGAASIEHAYPLSAQPSGGRETLHIRIEPGRVPRSFRYKLSANDATTGWRSVAVRVPPQLAPLDGRASPRVRLDYPTYSGLAPLDLPDGTGATEAVAGTSVTIRAATDRPVARAAVEYRPTAVAAPAALGGLLVAAGPDGALGLAAAAHALAAPTTLTLTDTGRRVDGQFTPALGGVYDLTLTDEHGLTGRRPLDVRVLPDPAPTVTLDQPSPGGDGLELVPEATLAVRATIEDPTFAVRRVAVEYRTRLDEPVRRLPLYDGDALGRAIATMLDAVPVAPARLRPVRLEVARRLPMAQFRRLDGSAVAAGDVIQFAVVAEDYDDVTPDKPPGRSFEVEVRVVNSDRLQARLQKRQADLAKALTELHERQAEALALAAEVERHRRATGEIRREDAERLARSEALQQQVRERLGNARDGVRADAERLRQAQADHAGEAARAKAGHTVLELDRLADEILPPIGGLLAAARRESSSVPAAERSAGSLPDAVGRQHEAEQTLRGLSEQIRAGAAAAELAVEATALAAEQEKLANERSTLAGRVPPGVDPGALAERDRKELDRLKDRQDALASRAAALLQQLDAKVAAQAQAAVNTTPGRAEAQQREAAALASARSAAHDPVPLDQTMRQASDALGRNRLGVAESSQQAAGRQLDAIRDALRSPTGEDAERLLKDRQSAEEAVERLTRDQEELQDRTLAAEQLADRVARQQALKDLAAAQGQLAEQARGLAQELRRQDQATAARDLARSARAMDQARERMERGEPAADQQDAALDRLDDARQQAADARVEAEESLRREKLVKLVDRLKGVHARQAGLRAECDRLFQAAADAKAWPRSLQKSFADLGRDEEALAKELEGIAEKDLAALRVFKRLAGQAAAAMADTAVAVDEARNAGPNVEALDVDKVAVSTPQDLALRRLAQLLEVLQPPNGDEEQSGGAGGRSSASGGSTPARESDGVPALAQLKLFRAMQAELNERIAAFDAAHPDPQKWTGAARAALDGLRREQAELAELFAEVAPEPVQPAEKKP